MPIGRFFESSWMTLSSRTSKMQIPPNTGPDCDDNALLLLSSGPRPVNMLPTQTFNSWNFNGQWKTKRSKARILYYSNSTASYQVLPQSGDISLNPGPVKCCSGIQSAESKQTTSGNSHRAPACFKCDNCNQTIRRNQKSVACEVCFGKQHIKCTK